MSSGDVDYLHIRLKDELNRLSLSMAAAARLIGEDDSQGIRDSCSGRKRVTAELLAKLGAVGVDANYVLTGRSAEVHQANQNVAPYGLKPDEAALLDNYRHSSEEAQAALRATSAALAQCDKRTKCKGGK